MSATTRPPAGRLRGHDRSVTVAVVGSGLVVAAGSAAQLIDFAFELGIDALDSAEDGGVFGAIGNLAATGAAAAAWVLMFRARPARPAALALPPLLTLITLDKWFRVHDHVPHYLVLYAPALAASLLGLVAVARRTPRPYARLIGTGLGLLVVTFVLHVTGGRVLLELGLTDDPWAHQIKAVVKHGCEVEAWFLLLIGLAAAALRAPRSLTSPRRRAAQVAGAPDVSAS
jgi:hypothetical protein